MLGIEKFNEQDITETQKYICTNDELERENSNFTGEEHGFHKLN